MGILAVLLNRLEALVFGPRRAILAAMVVVLAAGFPPGALASDVSPTTEELIEQERIRRGVEEAFALFERPAKGRHYPASTNFFGMWLSGKR